MEKPSENSPAKIIKFCPVCKNEFSLDEGQFVKFQCPKCKTYLKYKREISVSTLKEKERDFKKLKQKGYFVMAILSVALLASIIFSIYENSNYRKVVISLRAKLDLMQSKLVLEQALNGDYKLFANEFLQTLKANDREKLKVYFIPTSYQLMKSFLDECDKCGMYRLSDDGKRLYYKNRFQKEVFVPLTFSIVNGECLIDFSALHE